MSDKPTIEELIEKSSIGRSAWCGVCSEPDLLHEMSMKDRVEQGTDHPFRPMTHEEWQRRRAKRR